MGACTSKSQVLKDAGEAPVEKEEEEVVIKKDTLTRVPVVDDEDKRQSLGHLFKEDEGEKGSSEDNVAEQVKQETANEANKQPQEEIDLNATKTPEPVALAGAQPVEASETEKALPTEGLKPENNVEAVVAPANKTEEDKPAEAAIVETSKQQVVVEDKNKSIEKPAPAETTSSNLEASSTKVEEDNQKQENEEINKDDKKPKAEAPQMEVQENKKTDQEQQKPAPDEKKPLFKLWF